MLKEITREPFTVYSRSVENLQIKYQCYSKVRLCFTHETEEWFLTLMVKLFDFKHLKVYTKKFRETYKLHAGKQLDIAVFFVPLDVLSEQKCLKYVLIH